MGFNSGFKGLTCLDNSQIPLPVVDALHVCRAASNGRQLSITTQNTGDKFRYG